MGEAEGLVVGALLMLLVFALLPLLWWRRRQSSPREDESEPLVPQTARVVHQSGARRMRRRPTAASSSTVASSSNMGSVEDIYDEGNEEDTQAIKPSSKKEKKKQEREAERQAEEAARESRKMKQDWYDEMRRRRDEEREAKERLMEEEALARKAKEEEAFAVEFEKWKGEFSVDAEGTVENEMLEGNQDTLSDFVEHIQKQKYVPLEDLAAEFKLRTQDCINRITTLESMGRLSGVMDERGKYIYISPEEMKAVADYIKRQGRVSISHLASNSNQFIDLDQKRDFLTEVSSSEGIIVM